MDTFSLMLHVLFAAVLVGPQLLLTFAVVPATWLIDDESLRRRVSQVVTRRFAMMSGVSLVVLLVTGLYQFYEIVPEAIQDEMMDFRWGLVFTTKMTLFTLLVVMIAFHAMYFGPRVREVSERLERGEAETWELEALRQRSLMFSIAMVVVSVGVLFLGVTLGDHAYSYVPR